jgi:hypothetical protein
MHLPFPGTPFACWSQPQGADDGEEHLHAPGLVAFFLFFVVFNYKIISRLQHIDNAQMLNEMWF